jgi:hypothetical protein
MLGEHPETSVTTCAQHDGDGDDDRGEGDDDGDDDSGEDDSEEDKLPHVSHSEVESLNMVRVTQPDMGSIKNREAVTVKHSKCAWLTGTDEVRCQIIVQRSGLLWSEAAGSVRRLRDGARVTPTHIVHPHESVTMVEHPMVKDKCRHSGGGTGSSITPSAKRTCTAQGPPNVHTLSGPCAPTTRTLPMSGKGIPVGTGREIITKTLESMAASTAPDVQIANEALVPFVREHRGCNSVAARHKVIDDWGHLLIGTDKACQEAGLVPPYKMEAYPPGHGSEILALRGE